MAYTKNILMQKVSGHLGKEIVFKQYGDKTVVTKYPDMSKRKLTAKQKQVHETMEEANYKARSILADKRLRDAAQVRLNVTSNRLYTALIKEYFANVKKKKEAKKK